MRFAIATSDAYQCVLETLLRAGWQWDKLFVSPGDWMLDNKQVIARALELKVPVQSSPVTEDDLIELGVWGCQALVVASYQWKIPPWRNSLDYAVNFHPSPLPEARGPYPQVRALLEGRTSWGVTCHQLSDTFDAGDILDTETFALDPQECHESMCMKTQMAAGRLAARIALNLVPLWHGAVAQSRGSYWPLWTEADRTLDFNARVADIMRKVRAFGDLECVASVNGTTIFIHRAAGWMEPHAFHCGTVAHASNHTLVVAAMDGFIAVTEWSFITPGGTTGKFRH